MEHPFFKATQQPVAYFLSSFFSLSSKQSLLLTKALFASPKNNHTLGSAGHISESVKAICPQQEEHITSSLFTLKKIGMLEHLCWLSSFEPYPSTLQALYNWLRYERRPEPAFYQKIKKNPYLLQEAPGVGFITIDRIARKMGIQPLSTIRLLAVGKHALEQASANTGGACSKEIFLQHTHKLLLTDGLIDFSKIRSIVEQTYLLCAEKAIFVEQTSGNKNLLFSKKLFAAEEQSAQKILQMTQEKSILSPPKDGQLERFEDLLSLSLTEQQKAAIAMTFEHKISIITGRPGSGKTTLLKVLHPLLLQQDKKIQFAAPTGKAAKKISQALNTQAHTLHRLLSIGVEDNPNQLLQPPPLDVDVLIVDESSMLDIFLFKKLLYSIPKQCHLILIGDPDQLPSIGPGKVLKDLLDSHHVPQFELTNIQRQVHGSNIIDSALSVLKGELPLLRQKSQDCVFLPEENADNIGSRIAHILIKNVQPKYSLLHEVQILSATKQGPAGTDALNALLQETLNPPSETKTQITLQTSKKGIFSLRTGDKVIHLSNDIERVRISNIGKHAQHGVFNGEQGTVSHINLKDQNITVQFEDFYSVYSFKEAQQSLDLAYCITIHKFQGSESPVIFLVGHHSAAKILRSKNLLYTGITRAKNKCILIGSESFFQDCCNVESLSWRHTRLKSLLTGEQALQLECPELVRSISDKKHLEFHLKKQQSHPVETTQKTKRL